MKNLKHNDSVRNIAIIAHVDHGKTTLVDAMFRRCGLFREGQQVAERLMDSMDLERERGITIAAKNCAVVWKDVKINIIDTPGHADFGGEVERALSMADGALLLVDAAEGPLPQTRFVLKKTLEGGLRVIVVINKIDRKDARPAEVLSAIYDLFIDLGATEEQLEFPLLYAIGREGIAQKTLTETGEHLDILLDTILEELPPPVIHPEKPFQMLVSDLGYSDYMGRLAIGKVYNRPVHENDSLVCIGDDNEKHPLKVSKLQVYRGITITQVTQAEPGDIVVLSGIEDVAIGDTICTREEPAAMKRIAVDEPTVSMLFARNTSPFTGKEGRFVQAGKIRERLLKETLRNVSLRVEDAEDRDGFIVKGRGEFQMAILIEMMRREGYELTVSRPEVILRYDAAGKKLEPIEHLFVETGEEFSGIVTEKLSQRRGRMLTMSNNESGRVRMEFSVPSRALIGYRDEFLTDTRGTGIMNAYLSGYEPYRGDFPTRFTGSLVSDREGSTVPYGLYNLEPRGQMFIGPGEPVYEGMIIGEHNRDNDLDVNPCRAKKLTNLRAAAKDENVVLTPYKVMTLESSLNFITDDELVEITPTSVRMRKAVLLQADRRKIRI